MMRVRSLLLDTNVWLDYFLGEGPCVDAIKRLVRMGAQDRLALLYAPTTAKDLFYLIPRRLRRSVVAMDAPSALDSSASSASRGRTDVGSVGGAAAEEMSLAPVAWACIDVMMDLAIAAPQSLAECELARMMKAKFGDFEDNLIIAAAETAKADYIVTSDKELLRLAPEICITPQRAVDLLRFSIEENDERRGANKQG